MCVCKCVPCCVMSTGKLYITCTAMLWPTSLPLTIKHSFFSTRCRVEECCFLWGFNSLFTAVLLVQNPFLEANVNQSNFMSAQQGLSGPTLGVSGELHSCTFTKRNKAAEATSAPSSHRSQKDVTPAIPCFQAWHTTKPTVCHCCLFNTLFLDVPDAF